MDPLPAADLLAKASGVCPLCHQSVLPTYYFCPNCGTQLNAPPLSTSVGAQVGLYAFSIILPMICFLYVTLWKGWKYYRSDDQKAKAMGAIAISLLVLSTAITLYFVYVWTEDAIQSSINGINADMSIDGT